MLRLINFLVESSGIDGIDSNTSGGSKLNSAYSQIYDLVNSYVLPVIYAALGLFLLIKGALLGMQIVKAADEPQVRQEKIGSLKWLVIGVAIAFGVTIAVDVVMSVFRDSLLSTDTTAK